MGIDSCKDSRINWKWAGIIVVVAVPIMTLALVTLPRLMLNSASDIIVVRALDGPMKIKPSDVGGKTIDHQGLLVIEMLKNGISDAKNFETLRPKSANPEPPPITVDMDGVADNGAVIQTERLVGSKTTSIKANDLPKMPSTVLEKKSEGILSASVDIPLFVFQLAAFRSEAKAAEVVNLLLEKHNSRLKKIKLKTMRFDTGSNGVFYRVVSAPLSRLSAEETCTRLRRSGQDCFLRKFLALRE
jgi:hypothetical protein